VARREPDPTSHPWLALGPARIEFDNPASIGGDVVVENHGGDESRRVPKS
jgi:hypothetical protein